MVGNCGCDGYCRWQVENVFLTRGPKPANEATCSRAWVIVDVVVLVVVVGGWQRQIENVFLARRPQAGPGGTNSGGGIFPCILRPTLRKETTTGWTP